MTTIDQQVLKGMTIKNLIITITSTVSIVISVTASYFQLKGDIREIKTVQDSQSRINEIRLKVLENNVAVLQQQVNDIKNERQVR